MCRGHSVRMVESNMDASWRSWGSLCKGHSDRKLKLKWVQAGVSWGTQCEEYPGVVARGEAECRTAGPWCVLAAGVLARQQTLK